MKLTKKIIYILIGVLSILMISLILSKKSHKDHQRFTPDHDRFLKLERVLTPNSTVNSSITDNITLRLDHKYKNATENNLKSASNIGELYREYVTFLSNETSSAIFNAVEVGEQNQFISLNKTQGRSDKLSLGNDFYISDRLEYSYNKNWLFELEVNNVLFWIEADEDEKKSFIPSQEESSIATFSIKYSF